MEHKGKDGAEKYEFVSARSWDQDLARGHKNCDSSVLVTHKYQVYSAWDVLGVCSLFIENSSIPSLQILPSLHFVMT